MPDIRKISISIAGLDIEIVNRLVNERGMNFSSALRYIIREWDELAHPRQFPDSSRRQQTSRIHDDGR